MSEAILLGWLVPGVATLSGVVSVLVAALVGYLQIRKLNRQTSRLKDIEPRLSEITREAGVIRHEVAQMAEELEGSELTPEVREKISQLISRIRDLDRRRNTLVGTITPIAESIAGDSKINQSSGRLREALRQNNESGEKLANSVDDLEESIKLNKS